MVVIADASLAISTQSLHSSFKTFEFEFVKVLVHQSSAREFDLHFKSDGDIDNKHAQANQLLQQ
jgi:hypothetical protein